MLRFLLVAALLIGTAGEPAIARTTANIATTPISRMSLPWWRARFDQKQAELRQGPVDVVWLGDSITENWERNGPEPWANFVPGWRHFYDGRHAVNLGFKGDSTCHLLWRMKHGELDGIHPRLAILLIGANNFGHVHTDARQTFDGVEAILDVLAERLPRTRIIVIGVLPSIRSAWVTSNTTALNGMLRQALATRPMTEFVDASALFERNGAADPSRYLDPRLSPPGMPLHPDAAAEAALAARIEPIVASDLGDATRPPFGG